MKHGLQFIEQIGDDGFWEVTCECGWTEVTQGEVAALNKLAQHESEFERRLSS